MSNKNPVYVVQHNHFDPIWRRCWRRTFDYRGQRYRSYADFEERVINMWLENARRGIGFSEGQAMVFRKYLERNPERLQEIKELIGKGVIELTAAGETVADTNLPSGETLLRNLVSGQLFFEETFGVIPSLGWLEDAFGQSAQMPQLFRGVECNHILKRYYKWVPGDYWKGLDGSVVFVADAPCSHHAGHCIKVPPCPECNGMGCDECGGTGFANVGEISDDIIKEALSADYSGIPFSMMTVGGEENLPNLRLPELVEEAREKHGVDFRFGGFGAITQQYADLVGRIDDPSIEVSDQVEANPVSTGCYVTRIRIKQEFRRIENMVNAAERWATVAHVLGDDYPIECLTEAWQAVLFCAFHDAVTASHIDAAYFELADMLMGAEHEAGHVFESALSAIDSHIAAPSDGDYLAIYNSESWERNDPITLVLTGTRGRPTLRDSSGHELDVLDISAEGEDITLTFRPPKVAALGYAAVEVIPDSMPIDTGEITAGPGEIENEYYRIRISDRGINSIWDKKIGREILEAGSYLANELILEEDIGHPWGTIQAPSFSERLSAYTTSVSIRRAANAAEITLTGQYKGNDSGVKILTWRQSVKLYKGVDRIDFTTKIDWDTAQRRIRIAFPTGIRTSEGYYSIPYGVMKRGPYEPEMDEQHWSNGDWPAVNWVDVFDEERNSGVALVNSGTPSHKIENGIIFLSVLRSPTDSWFLNELQYYDCPDFDGARDTGTHEFYYSLIAHSGDYAAGAIEKRAREVNVPLIARALEGSSNGRLEMNHSFMNIEATDNVIVTAIKKAERDGSVIVRLAETAGKQGEARVTIEGAGNKISMVNFLERNPQPVSEPVKLDPFKIITMNQKDQK